MSPLRATVGRADQDELQAAVSAVVRHPVVDGLLSAAGGLLAVLNPQRQILALNQAFLAMLAIDDAAAVLGLRPGEAIGCVHADEGPDGCGTGPDCPTCGCVAAVVESLDRNRPVERTCALSVARRGRRDDLFLRVRAAPVNLDGMPLVVVFLQDISLQQKWQAIERLFFHDVNNLVSGLLSTSEFILDGKGTADVQLVQDLQLFARRLAGEFEMQRSLIQDPIAGYQPMIRPVALRLVFEELVRRFANHPAARRRRLAVPPALPELSLNTDFALLMRVLTNMVTNAFEAIDAGQAVRVDFAEGPSGAVFSVSNPGVIPPENARRIFQRNFSTKGEAGRGLGTYSMKLFGEQWLGGRVEFTTAEADGTVFRFHLLAERSTGEENP